tara:strand:+ start:3920 stop:4768 length:849 start_codon:yes stop_codon:yes gene_type:complete
METNKKFYNIHERINDKLDYFIKTHKIPHIIFYGPSGSGKRYILNNFVDKIYKKDKEKIKEYVMWVNCAHSKGIRFIRHQLKFFAKRNMQNNNGKMFKSIILFNAEQLTVDAQSALRRCIEIFSHNTRFFIIVQDLNSLLTPILSRFCNIYVPKPIVNNKKTNLYKINNEVIIDKNNDKISNKNFELKEKKYKWLKNFLNKKETFSDYTKINEIVDKLYFKGYSGLDIQKYILNSKNHEKYNYLFYFDKIRKEFRDEKLLMFIYLYLFFMRKKIDLENIFTM